MNETRVRVIAVYGAVWAGLFVVSLFSTCLLGPNIAGFLVFPVPVAVYVARRRLGAAMGLLACAASSAALAMAIRAAFAALLWANSPPLIGASTAWAVALTAVYYVLESSAGLVLGFGIQRRWTYGQLVAGVACVILVVSIGNDLLAWDEWRAGYQAYLDEFVVAAQRVAETDSNTQSAIMLDVLDWLRGHWLSVVFGWIFVAVLFTACVLVSVAARWVRVWFGDPGPIGSFVEMRPPEWLVWVAIVAALLWLVDQRWPNTAAQMISWNTAIALAAVYWLNGVAIFLYGTRVLRPNVFVYTAFVLLLVYSGLATIPCMLGLFDTWADLRRKLAAWAAALRERDKSREDDDDWD